MPPESIVDCPSCMHESGEGRIRQDCKDCDDTGAVTFKKWTELNKKWSELKNNPVVCSISNLGSREFICIGHDVFPIDRIVLIDTIYPYIDSADDPIDSVRIFLTKPKQELCWSDGADAKAIRSFLRSKGFNVEGEV